MGDVPKKHVREELPDLLAPYHFLLKRLHSLTGIFPVGAFLMEHLFVNSFATNGPQAYNDIAALLEKAPFLLAIEITFIWIPILFHALLGLVLIYQGSVNTGSYTYPRNWMYVVQRVTGVITLIFIGYHFWTTRLDHMLHGTEIGWDMMAGALRSPGIFWFYAVGVVSAVFHFANGIWSALITWGITVGERAQRVAFSLCLVVFAVMTFMGLSSLLSFVRAQ